MVCLSHQIRLDQISRSVVSDSLWPHESQHARPPCPSPTPGVHSDSRSSSQWCHPAISSSVVPFFSCPQSLPASESFPMSQLFAWGGQSIGVSALASFLPKKSQGWSPSEWTREVIQYFSFSDFTQCDYLEVHPCCCKWYYFIFNGLVIFHCMYVPHLLYPFLYQRTRRILKRQIVVSPYHEMKPISTSPKSSWLSVSTRGIKDKFGNNEKFSLL